MRTTIDINKELLDEALKLSKIRTKKELINLSLQEYVRKIRLKNLKNRIGNYDLTIDVEDLEEGRKDE
ncbi:MAG: PF09957 family protein [Parcubacteria bacterium 34_609]|nr:MAG: PF09957 family protein [Parcubacteria bacterium 34_609]